jgi:hypothetical protein
MQWPGLKGREALEKTDEDGPNVALNETVRPGGARSGADSGTRVITSSGLTAPPNERDLDTPESGVLNTLPRIVVA